ncbi:thiol-disulfide oxidoreductase DCC family protein [Sutcliffiella deserti]|uniref:thiol-disulfide oxidoreductase DCC family protein n=1 Tax=Sutcliffiella deserti TaxID=2875501 RepID=UPI001CBED193|nr:thiol-disulfide oxidoreductase DCC family protein [Sutcliffiella deserti]
MSNNTSSKDNVLLFDGVCNMCNSLVIFVMSNDKEGKYKFASLQSESGQNLLSKFNLPTNDFNSFIYIIGDNYYTKSTAGLKVLRGLDGFWKCLYPLILIPKPIRDVVYAFIAKNRYRWFGRKEQCMLPTPEMKKRFL